MATTAAPVSIGADARRYLGTAAACILLAGTLLACAGGDEDASADDRLLDLEAQVDALEASLEALAAENAALQDEIALLRQQQADSVAAQEAASKPDANPAAAEKPSDGKAAPSPKAADGLVAESGGEAHYIQHPDRVDPALLLVPLDFVAGETPLIVSLHGFGGDAADHARYVPLHERVNRDGFALLLPNGQRDGAGSRFWNPTDRCCDGGKSGGDDVAYLTDLVASARQVGDLGPLYFFGYSNGGFMAYHMACKGLPGLRAVASLAGTSYVEDSACEGAPPVSVLHIHGAADGVIRFDGDASQPDAKGAGEPAFYAGARDMVTRWSQRAGCAWTEGADPQAALDLDPHLPGAETQVFRLQSGCAPGITIELWTAVGGGHAPAYGDAFVDALLGWLLSQG